MSSNFDAKALYKSYKSNVRSNQMSRQMPIPDLSKSYVPRPVKSEKDALNNSADIYYINANAEKMKVDAEKYIKELEKLRDRANAEGHFDVANRIDILLDMARPVVSGKKTAAAKAQEEAEAAAAAAEAAARHASRSPGRASGGGGGGSAAPAASGGGGGASSGGGCSGSFCPKAAAAAWNPDD